MLFQVNEKQNSVNDGRADAQGLSPLPKRQSVNKRASSLDPRTQAKVESSQMKGKLVQNNIENIRRISLLNKASDKSTTERANSDTVNSKVRG